MTVHSVARVRVQEQLDEWINESKPGVWEKEAVRVGGWERLLDLHLAFDTLWGARSIYLQRYRHAPRVRLAILNLRTAAKELVDALVEERRNRMDADFKEDGK